MLVVETLVALVEHSLLYEPTPVPVFQLVLNSVGAGPGTSRSAIADVLAESAASSIVRHIPCVPPNVPSETILEELAAWAGLGAGAGGGVGGEEQRGSHWATSFAGGGSALTGFGLSRVVPLDPLVVFLAVAGSGSLEERIHSAFWTLDRDGTGYLTLEQLLRLNGLLVAVAAAGRLILGQPPLPRGLTSEPSLLGVRGGTSPNPSPASTIPGQLLRPQQQQQPGMAPMDAGALPRGTDGGTAASAATLQPQQTVPTQGPAAAVASAAASGSTVAASGDGSRALLDAALISAFHEHCLPAEGRGAPPARLTADRLALVVQSAVEYITMAVVHHATAPHVLSGDNSYGHHLRSGFQGHYPSNHHYPHISRRSFGASGAAAAVHAGAHARINAGQHTRTSSQSHHSLQPSYHHQRHHSSNSNTPHVGGPAPPPPLPPPARLQRPLTTSAAAIAGGRGSSGGYSPSQRQYNMGQCAAPFQSSLPNSHSEVSLDRGSTNQLSCVAAGNGLSYSDAALDPNLNPNLVHFLSGNGVGAAAPADGGVTPVTRGHVTSDVLKQNSDVLRRHLSSVAVTATASSSALIMGSKSPPTNVGARLTATATTATVATSWMGGWTWRRAERGAPSPLGRAGTSGQCPLAADGNLATREAPQQPGSWLASSFWAATSYIGGAMWGFGRPAATEGRSVPAAAAGAGSNGGTEGLVRGPNLVGPATVEMTGSQPLSVTRPVPAGLTEPLPLLATPLATLTRGPTASAPSVAAAAAAPVSSPARGSPLGRVCEHTDVSDLPEQQPTIRYANATSSAAAAGGVTPSSVGMGRRTCNNPLVGLPVIPAESSSNGDRKPTDPVTRNHSNGASGGGGLDVGRAAAVDMSALFATDAGPALLADFSEAEKPALGGGNGGSVKGSAGGAGSGNGNAAGGGGGGGGVTYSNRSVSGLLTKWRRASKSVAAAGDAQGSPGQVTAGGTPAVQSAGSGGVAADQNQGHDGTVVDEGSNGGGRRRTHPAFGSGGGTGGGDGSVHGGGAAALQRAAGLDTHLLFSSMAHAPHSIEEAASRAEQAAKVEAAAAFTRGGAAAATAGGAGGIGGGREAATAPTGAAGGAGGGGGGTVLPPLQRAIRSSVQQAGVKLFLHCGMCLLAIIALLLLDAALVAWIYLDRKQRLSRSLIIVAATNTGLVLLVLLISIVRSFMADRASALEVAAARQAARGGAAAGGTAGGAGGVLGFLLSNFVTPTLQTMGIMRGHEEAAAGRATGPGTQGGPHGSGGHEGGGWGTRLRVLWTTIGRVAGFDNTDDHGSGNDAAGAGGPGPGGHHGLPHGGSSLTGPQYAASHAAFDLEARAGGGPAGVMRVAGGAGIPGVSTGHGLGGGGSSGSGQLGSSPYAPDGTRRSLGLGTGGSPFTSLATGTPEAGAMMGPEAMGMGMSTSGAGGPPGSGGTPGSGGGGALAPGGGAYTGGTAARERTRGSALPATYYSSVPTMQRVEAAYPAL